MNLNVKDQRDLQRNALLRCGVDSWSVTGALVFLNSIYISDHHHPLCVLHF